MSRPLRIQYPGAWYHVMNRGAGYRPIFQTDKHLSLFLSLLGEIAETFGIEIHAYCLMDTHYHLLVCCPQGNLSRAMRHLNGVFTQRFNRSVQTDGPLFRGRFKAILVDADNYLAQLSRYIHLNPVESRITKHPGAFKWSSYRAYLGRVQAPKWLYLQQTLRLFGKQATQKHYRNFVESGIDEEILKFYNKPYLNPVLGSKDFQKWIKKHLLKGYAITEVPDVKKIVHPPTIDSIIQVTAKEFGVSYQHLYTEIKGRGQSNIPRQVAISLTRSLTGLPLQGIAEKFRLGHYSSVSVALRRLKGKIHKDLSLAKKVKTIQNQLNL